MMQTTQITEQLRGIVKGTHERVKKEKAVYNRDEKGKSVRLWATLAIC